MRAPEFWARPGLLPRLLAREDADVSAHIGAVFAAEDIDGVVNFAKDNKIDFVVVGPEGPLVAGMVDRLNALGAAAIAFDSRCAPSPTSSVRRDVAGRASGADAREPSAPWAFLARSRCKPLGFARWATRRRPPRRAPSLRSP